MVIEPGNIFYCHVSPEDAFEIVYQTVIKGEPIEHLLYTDSVTGEMFKTQSEIPFYKSQNRQVLSQNLMIDPCSIEDYIVTGGYSALPKVLSTFGLTLSGENCPAQCFPFSESFCHNARSPQSRFTALAKPSASSRIKQCSSSTRFIPSAPMLVVTQGRP